MVGPSTVARCRSADSVRDRNAANSCLADAISLSCCLPLSAKACSKDFAYCSADSAHSRSVAASPLAASASDCRMRRQSASAMAAAMLVTVALGGCITVNAPEKPIVIELNVNIRQEVIYRLAEDAGNTIEDNADIF